MALEHEAGPREVLERLRQAAISQSADDMSSVYAVDAVHEFPFTRPGVPSRLDGRDEIVNWIAAGWKAYPLKYERYRTLAIYDTSDPETIIVEQEALGTSASTGSSRFPISSCSPCATGRSPVCATTSTSRPPQAPWDAISKPRPLATHEMPRTKL